MDETYILACCECGWSTELKGSLAEAKLYRTLVDCGHCFSDSENLMVVEQFVIGIRSERNDGPPACWEPCDDCDGYICNVHGVHTEDCDCEPVEWWDERGMWPYETTVAEYLYAHSVIITEEY